MPSSAPPGPRARIAGLLLGLAVAVAVALLIRLIATPNDRCLGPPRAAVQVAVLDTLPDASDRRELPPDSHGARVLAVIRESACERDAPCTVEISTHAALPRFDNPATANDGPAKFGTRHDLAAAISRAVTTHLRGPDPARLIVNISAGWDTATGCVDTPRPADVQAVHQALALAHCGGALVFVATGNVRLPGVESDGPLCPARWEDEPPPDPATCETLLARAGLSPPAHAPDPARPFLTAVSGLADDGTPLPTALPRSQATLASESRGPANDPRAPHGTSFASARVSGIAAAIWSRRPEWSAREVLQHLHAASAPQDLRSDFGVDAPQPVRRVSRALLSPDGCAADE